MWSWIWSSCYSQFSTFIETNLNCLVSLPIVWVITKEEQVIRCMNAKCTSHTVRPISYIYILWQEEHVLPKKKNCNETTTRNTPFILMILAREIVVFNVWFLSYENRKIASASTFHFEDKNWHSNFWEVFSGSVIAFWVLWYSKNGLYLSNQIEKTCLRK